jgi:protein-disulfide isomerase/uncharacterized membrane protein
MKNHKLLGVLGIVFFFGLILSAQLIYDHYQIVNGAHHKSLCNLGGIYNCEAVNASSYSVLFGIPLATWGFSFYFFAFLFTTLAFFWQEVRKELVTLLLPLSAFSVLLSLVLLYISLSQIHSLCIFCMGLYAVNLLAFIILFVAQKNLGSTWLTNIATFNKDKLTWIVGSGLILTAAVIAVSQSFKEDELPLDLDNFMFRYSKAEERHIPIDGSATLGNPNATLKIVEFSDFECPFCARQSREVKKILLNYGSQVSFIFKHYPLDMSCNSMMKRPMHKNACLAAQAAYCAYKQNHFGPFHEELFHNQKKLDEAQILQMAQDEPMDMAAFKACLYSEDAKNAVRTDIALGQDLGIQGTPTFFINGKKIEGLVTKEAVGRILQGAASP